MMDKTRRADAEYIASMCKELVELAEQNGFFVGAYLLKMACLEFAKQRDQLDKRTAGGSAT